MTTTTFRSGATRTTRTGRTCTIPSGIPARASRSGWASDTTDTTTTGRDATTTRRVTAPARGAPAVPPRASAPPITRVRVGRDRARPYHFGQDQHGQVQQRRLGKPHPHPLG